MFTARSVAQAPAVAWKFPPYIRCDGLLPPGNYSRQMLRLAEVDFEIFAPQRRHVAPMEVKFGTAEATEGPLGKFHPHQCTDKGIEPLKLKFLLRFDQNVEYKRPTGAYPLRDFHKISRICIPFRMR